MPSDKHRMVWCCHRENFSVSNGNKTITMIMTSSSSGGGGGGGGDGSSSSSEHIYLNFQKRF
jgi:hypothetical protein